MKSRQLLLEVALVLAALIAATTIIAINGTDIALSSIFLISGKWPIGDNFPWSLLYHYERAPAVLMAVTGLGIAIFSFYKPYFKHWRRYGVFLALFLVLGPGLLVNVVFKDCWGRPRPRDVVQFGGKKDFLQPWEKGEIGNGKSFPSGHASAAFFMMAPFFIYRHRKPVLARYWLIGGIFYGIMMSIARILQGGHFLSDTIWSFGMIYLTGLLLSAAMRLDREDNPSLPP